MKRLNKWMGKWIIFGKQGHAEVVGLLGQTNNNAIVVASIEDLEKIDFTKSIYIYSQTTKSPKAYHDITLEIEKRVKMSTNTNIRYIVNDTLCRQVSGREPHLKQFANINDVIIFVSGKKSSNGRMLYQSCKNENQKFLFYIQI